MERVFSSKVCIFQPVYGRIDAFFVGKDNHLPFSFEMLEIVDLPIAITNVRPKCRTIAYWVAF